MVILAKIRENDEGDATVSDILAPALTYYGSKSEAFMCHLAWADHIV